MSVFYTTLFYRLDVVMIEDLTVGSGLRFTFVVDELPPSTFAVIKFEGIEALSDPFKFV